MTATESITTGRAKLRTGVSAAAPANAAKIGVSGRASTSSPASS